MSPTRREYVLNPPIVFERRPKKKKVSPTLRDAQEMERHLTRAVHRTVRAADRGLRVYRRARKKSATRKDDGVLVDFVPNVLRGSAAAMGELALVPYHLWRATYTRQARRLTRRSLRFVARLTDDLLDE